MYRSSPSTTLLTSIENGKEQTAPRVPFALYCPGASTRVATAVLSRLIVIWVPAWTVPTRVVADHRPLQLVHRQFIGYDQG